MHMLPASVIPAFSLHPFLARLRDPVLEQSYRRSIDSSSPARLIRSLYSLACAVTGLAMLPPAQDWPGALFCLLMAALLLAPGKRHAATLLLGMSGFLACYSQRNDIAAWHDMAYCALLLALHASATQRVLWIAMVGAIASITWLALQEQVQAGTLATLLALNFCALCVCWSRQRQQRQQFLIHLRLTRDATCDHLTGCYNRRYLDEHLLANALARSTQRGDALSAIMCDLDHFKRINDQLGHAGGDAVLRNFAQLLKDAIRHDVDSVVRHGGEEFLLILPATDAARALGVAERLRASLPQQISATASFGVATVVSGAAGEALSPAALIEAADQQLYLAKRAGRNCVRTTTLQQAPTL